jgi:hypothetical protein
MGQTTTMAEETRQGSNRVAAQEEKSWNEPVLGLALPILSWVLVPGRLLANMAFGPLLLNVGLEKQGRAATIWASICYGTVIIVVQLDGLCSRMPTHPQT